jgi:hypothetical protein
MRRRCWVCHPSRPLGERRRTGTRMADAAAAVAAFRRVLKPGEEERALGRIATEPQQRRAMEQFKRAVDRAPDIRTALRDPRVLQVITTALGIPEGANQARASRPASCSRTCATRRALPIRWVTGAGNPRRRRCTSAPRHCRAAGPAIAGVPGRRAAPRAMEPESGAGAGWPGRRRAVPGTCDGGGQQRLCRVGRPDHPPRRDRRAGPAAADRHPVGGGTGAGGNGRGSTSASWRIRGRCSGWRSAT